MLTYILLKSGFPLSVTNNYFFHDLLTLRHRRSKSKLLLCFFIFLFLQNETGDMSRALACEPSLE